MSEKPAAQQNTAHETADEELRTRLGRAARESALRFSWESTVRSHHELYQRLAPAVSA